MKRFLGAGIIVPLLLAISISPASAESAGSKCSKIGRTAFAGKTKLICKRIQGKQVWAKVTNGKTSSTGTKPEPSRFLESCPEYLAVISDPVGELVCAQMGIFNWKWTKRAQALSPAAHTAFDSVASRKHSDATEQPINLVVSSTVTSDRIAALRNALAIAADFWRSDYWPITPPSSALITEKDRQFYRDFLQSSTLSARDISTQVDNYDRIVAMTGSRTLAAGVFGEDGDYGYYLWGTDSRAGQHAGWISAPAHEWTHAVQLRVFGWQRMPCWFVEGQAAYYGIAIASKDEPQFRDLRKEFLNQNYEISIRETPRGGWQAWLDARDNPYIPQTCGKDGSYPVGFLATEYMLSLKGHEGVQKFMQLGATMPWKGALQEVFGVPWATFVENFIRYLNEETSRLGW